MTSVRRPATALAAVTVALTVTAGLTAGCATGSGGHVTTPGATTVVRSALDHAVSAVNATRRAALADWAAIPPAATRLDATDQLAATGNRPAVGARRRADARALTAANKAVAALPARAAAYAAAVRALDAALARAGRHIKAPGTAAVATAARAEADVLVTAGTSLAPRWPAYAALHRELELWWTRADAGYFSSTTQSADAYIVLSRPERPAVDAARALLATTASRIAAASAATSAAIGRAD